LVDNAIEGDTAAIREIFDRMDGKVPTRLVGDKDNPLEVTTRVERHIVDHRPATV
jgi:hypothetical protein